MGPRVFESPVGWSLSRSQLRVLMACFNGVLAKVALSGCDDMSCMHGTGANEDHD
jgi:hypothetical protein